MTLSWERGGGTTRKEEEGGEGEGKEEGTEGEGRRIGGEGRRIGGEGERGRGNGERREGHMRYVNDEVITLTFIAGVSTQCSCGTSQKQV